MAELISSINSVADFFFIQKNYKNISNLANKELKFYFFSLDEKMPSLAEILSFVIENTQWCNANYRLIEETDTALLFCIDLEKFNSDARVSSNMILYFNKIDQSIISLTDEDSEHFALINNFIDRFSQYLNRKFIKSADIVNIIENFLTEGYYVTTSMVSSKKWWEKVRRTVINYPTDVPIEKVLKQLSDEKSFINSIEINIFNKSGENRLLKASLSRRGLIRFRDGFFELFQEKLIKKILIETRNEKELLKNRERSKIEINPLRISFERLAEALPIDVTKQFAKSISNNKGFSFAVMHNGNPYFHASVTYNLDSSVFDIIFQHFENGPELIIIPQYSVSLNSLLSFFSLVYSQFGEGKLSDFSFK
jgi:hypothetical protein